MNKRGFTLVELLVVIAIIGILASVILVSLGAARSSAVNTAVKANLDTVRTQAELYANDPAGGNGGYGAAQTAVAYVTGSSCGTLGMWANPTIAAATKAASSGAGAASTLGGVSSGAIACVSSSSFWLVAGVLKSAPTTAWCVDSLGVAKVSTVANMDTLVKINALTTCPN